MCVAILNGRKFLCSCANTDTQPTLHVRSTSTLDLKAYFIPHGKPFNITPAETGYHRFITGATRVRFSQDTGPEGGWAVAVNCPRVIPAP